MYALALAHFHRTDKLEKYDVIKLSSLLRCRSRCWCCAQCNRITDGPSPVPPCLTYYITSFHLVLISCLMDLMIRLVLGRHTIFTIKLGSRFCYDTRRRRRRRLAGMRNFLVHLQHTLTEIHVRHQNRKCGKRDAGCGVHVNPICCY